jgi:hypothetical protein
VRDECRTGAGRCVVGRAGSREVLAELSVARTVRGIAGVEWGGGMIEGEE